MPQSLSAVYVHLVFSTKGRRAFLQDVSFRNQLHAFLGGVSRKLDCPTIAIGGAADHVHVLAFLGRSVSQADWVKELKRVSTQWIKENGTELAGFQWQSGYAVFSVSHSNVPQVVAYIGGQEEHHRAFTFEEEIRLLFQKHEVAFDERYVWD